MENTLTLITAIRKLMIFSAPLMSNFILNIAPMLLANWLLSRLGPDYLAAAALATPIYMTLMMLGSCTLNAVSIQVANQHGARQSTLSNLANALYTASLLSVLFCSILILVPHVLQHFFRQKYLLSYMQAFFYWGAVAVWPLFIKTTINQYLVGIGQPRWGLIMTIISIPIEFLLLYTFILGKFSFKSMGLSGIAIASFINDFLILIGYIWLIRKHLYKIWYRKSQCFKWSLIWQLLRLGLPIGIQISNELCVLTVVMWLLGRWGETVLTAAQITQQYSLIIVMIMRGVSIAICTLISASYGANNHTDIRQLYRASFVVMFLIILPLSSCMVLKPKLLFDWYLHTDLSLHKPILSVGIPFMQIGFIYIVLDAVRFIYESCLRGLQQSQYPMRIGVFSSWLFSLPLAYSVTHFFQQGPIGFRYWLLSGVIVSIILLAKRCSDRFNRLHATTH